MSSPFPCSPVIRECLWKKTQIEKKNPSQSDVVPAMKHLVIMIFGTQKKSDFLEGFLGYKSLTNLLVMGLKGSKNGPK